MNSDHTDTPDQKPSKSFNIEVQIPDQLPRSVEVIDQIMAGLDPRNDLILIDPKIHNRHFLFCLQNEILSLYYLGKDGDASVNHLPLERGKLYLLEDRDIIRSGKVFIRVKASSKKIEDESSSEEVMSRTQPLERDDHLPPPITVEAIALEKEKQQELKTQIEVSDDDHIENDENAQDEDRFSWFKVSNIDLIPYKIYGFFLDLAFTYLVLGFVFPLLNLHHFIQDFLFPVTQYVIDDYVKTNFFGHYNFLSLIEFFICFHVLMISFSLLFGTTPGALLIGIQQDRKNSNFLFVHFKAYIYSLINIFALPFFIFDFPFINGKTFKEFITLSSRELNQSIFYNISRKTIAPLFLAFSLISPLFLKSPFDAILTTDIHNLAPVKHAKTKSINTYSSKYAIGLNTQLDSQYEILPFFEKSKLGFILHDLKNSKSLIAREENRIPYERILFKLRYSNPISSKYVPDHAIKGEVVKTLCVNSLLLSMETIKMGATKFGPLMANAYLLKEEFIKSFSNKDQLLVLSLKKSNPFIKISNGVEERFFLFAKNEIIEFSMTSPRQSPLEDIFVDEILDKLTFNYQIHPSMREPGLFESFEAFERSHIETLLTYYSLEAKRALESNDPNFKVFLVKNLDQTKKTLQLEVSRNGMTRNIEKSFDEIINSIQKINKKSSGKMEHK
jgi:hypothetical protein